MIRLVFALRRKAELSREEFQQYAEQLRSGDI